MNDDNEHARQTLLNAPSFVKTHAETRAAPFDATPCIAAAILHNFKEQTSDPCAVTHAYYYIDPDLCSAHDLFEILQEHGLSVRYSTTFYHSVREFRVELL